MLEGDAKNVKALYRKGHALTMTDEWDAAKRCLDRVLQLDPENAAAKKMQQQLKARISKQNKKEKAMFSKMFKEDTRKAATTPKTQGERKTPKSPERREPAKPSSRNLLGAGRAAAVGAALLAVLIGFVALRRRAGGPGH